MLMLLGCGSKHPSNSKLAPNDPYAETMVESQFFEIDPTESQVFEAANGTRLAVPANAFLDAQGNPVTAPVKLELAEATSPDDIMLSNLAGSAENPLQVDAAMYINATANGEEVQLNPENPLYVELPTPNKSSDTQLYSGTRDKDGEMHWEAPQPLVTYLIPVPMRTLSFYPPNFWEEVKFAVDFYGRKPIDTALVDSFYYSLAVTMGHDLTKGFQSTELQEAFQNKYEIKHGKYTSASYETEADTIGFEVAAKRCGINPLSIKALLSGKFDSTFVATREFNERLQLLFRNQIGQELLEIYLANLHKNLCHSDSLVGERLGWPARWRAFAAQGLTNIENAPPHSRKLQRYMQAEMRKTEKALEKVEAKARAARKEANEAAKKVATEYKQVLWKREKHRMESYGFEWGKKTGWMALGKPAAVVIRATESVSITVEEPEEFDFDRMHAYLWFPNVSSLFHMQHLQGEGFRFGDSPAGRLPAYYGQSMVAILIGYKNDKTYVAEQHFAAKSYSKIVFEPKEVTTDQLKDVLARYSSDKPENSLGRDLEYQGKLNEERQRQQQLAWQQESMNLLARVAFPACNEVECDTLDGEALFSAKCTSCHAVCKKSTGPVLRGLLHKRSFGYLVAVTRNSQRVLADGDPTFDVIYTEYNETVMPSVPNLTVAEIRAIYEYLERECPE